MITILNLIVNMFRRYMFDHLTIEDLQFENDQDIHMTLKFMKKMVKNTNWNWSSSHTNWVFHKL
jgi:hypothetical protein